MDTFTAINICEGVESGASEEDVINAWQHLIDTGVCWSLQGYFGRTANRLIELGFCHANKHIEKESQP